MLGWFIIIPTHIQNTDLIIPQYLYQYGTFGLVLCSYACIYVASSSKLNRYVAASVGSTLIQRGQCLFIHNGGNIYNCDANECVITPVCSKASTAAASCECTEQRFEPNSLLVISCYLALILIGSLSPRDSRSVCQEVFSPSTQMVQLK